MSPLVQQVRNLMKDDRCAALVLYVDSPGGSATASEAMASALDEFGKNRAHRGLYGRCGSIRWLLYRDSRLIISLLRLVQSRAASV